MKNSIKSLFLLFIALTLLICGCVPAPTPVPPTFTPEPIVTSMPVPSPTSLPGSVVVPLETLGKSFPWLPIDKSARPSTYFFYFNLSKPPFDNVLARQAFAAAIDREILVEVAKKFDVKNPRPATTFTSPETLGRELYNEVGIPFNPAHAKDLLTQAGYSDPGKFPPVTLLIGVASSDVPGFHPKIAETMVDMWQRNLGVKIKIETLDRDIFLSRIASDPTEIFRAIFFVGKNDPNDFLSIFHTGAKYNNGGFSDPEYDRLVELAMQIKDPAERQEFYIQAERILCERGDGVNTDLPRYLSLVLG